MKIEQMKIGDIYPYQRNAKKHDKRQIDNVAESIKQFGMVQPIVIDKDNNVIIGHCRLLACKKLKMRNVPVVKLEDLTPEEANKLRLLDNKLNESDWDFDLLAEDIPTLNFDGFDIDWGIDFDTKEEESADTDSEQEDLFDDIEKQEKHYGVPYQGNKSRIADIIISILPSGNRLVDLFGGGGAITHCALLSDKWTYFLYNDLNKMITGLFLDAIHGKYHDEHRVITREQFEREKETDAYIKYIWSFGNNGTGYLWGKDIEEIKCTACHSLLDESLTDRRLAYIHFLQMLGNTKDPTPNRLAPIERLEAIEKLEALNRLEALNIDYRQYEYQEGDVVYCDVPYEQMGKAKCDDYGVLFNSKEFYEWAKTRPYQVFFSSYEISDKSFYKVKVKSVMSLIGANTNGQFVTEYLYSNKPIEYKGVIIDGNEEG